MSSLGDDLVPSYRNCQGSWRPDFLLEKVGSVERYRICEINCRFAFNGFFHTTFAQQAYINMDNDHKRLTAPAAHPQDVCSCPQTLLISNEKAR